MRKPASPPTARAEKCVLVRRIAVIAGSFGIPRLLLFHASIRLLVARLVMDDTVRIDDDHLILLDGQRLPIVARAFPVSTPPIAAGQVDVELRVD